MSADPDVPFLHAISSYDLVPYPKMTHRHTHLRHLEMIATVFGMKPASVANCRMLELGCAAGWNLAPMASDFPNSSFLGVDLSARQIGEGQELLAAAGLQNVELRNASILDVDASWGKFDYIVCHGVFSWVPDEVQQKILTICRENLAPHGVAFVSYNVYPGWHMRGIVRDMMLFHTLQFPDPRQKVEEARALLEVMSQNCTEHTTYERLLKDECRILREVEDSYLFHEHLEAHNRPMYFYQFMEKAQRHGLQYLAEADISRMLSRFLPDKIQEAIQQSPLVRQEQYMDFLRNNTFRRTLLCHQNVSLDRTIRFSAFTQFRLSMAARPASVEFDVHSPEMIEFQIGGGYLRTDRPLVKAALHQMVDTFPCALSLDELYRGALARLSPDYRATAAPDDLGWERLAKTMFGAFGAGLLDATLHPPQFVPHASDAPRATPLARAQAERGYQVVNQIHELVTLDAPGRQILGWLDGHCTREMIYARLEEAFDRGHMKASREGQPLENIDADFVKSLVDHQLARLAKCNLLVA